MTIETMTDEQAGLLEDQNLEGALRALSRRFAEAATQLATDHDDEAELRVNAAQTRLMADLVVDHGRAAGEAWLEAGERLLDAREQSAMDEVHESRSSRREATTP